MERSFPMLSGIPTVRVTGGKRKRIMSISIVITVTIMMITVRGCTAYEKDEVPRLLDVPRYFRESKELHGNQGYVEHCRPTNLRKEQLGHVNVFAFLDPFWYYSHRQAIMLELLKKRLENSGFTNILFFVVTPPPHMPEDNMENNVEIKAWREISKNIQGSEYFLSMEETMFSDLARKQKGIIFLQDTFELGIWKSFRASKDEVVVIDRCGKLTWQIILPWSILYFPYVKAAILSTYKEDPCGPCYEQSSTIRDSMNYEEHRLKTINSDEASIDTNLNAHTERIFTDLHTVNIQSKSIENDKNTATTVSFDSNVYESTIYDITTKTSNTLNTETTGNKKNNIEDNPFLADKNIKIITAIPLEPKEIVSTMSNFETTEVYEDAQDCTFSKKQVDENNNDSFSTTNDSNIDLPNHNYHDIKSDIILRDTKRKGQEVNENPTQDLQIQKDEGIPLRIILYAPHLHEENGTLKTYTHLVLKTSNRDYHDHFHSRSKTSSQESAVIERSNSMILNDKKLAEYVNTVDESPGIYGEIADYWQTTDKDELDNINEDAELTDYDYATAEDTGSSIDDTFDNKSSILKSSDKIDSNRNGESNDDLNDVMQRRLIEHHNKLLTWIYYIL